MRIRGRVLKLGDNISTDHILPSRLKYQVTTLEEMARFVLVGVSEDMPRRIKPGTIIVAGENFGYGSSREHAARALKMAGVSAVLALSFARIFYRNAVNIGLPVLTIPPEAYDSIREGDEVEVDTEQGILRITGSDTSFTVGKMPALLETILREGGIMDYIKKHRRLPWASISSHG